MQQKWLPWHHCYRTGRELFVPHLPAVFGLHCPEGSL